MADLLRRLLLLQLLLAPALSFNITLERVMAADSEDGRIVSLQYWDKFRDFMNLLNEADFDNRTQLLTIPNIHEFMVPPELLSAVSASLNSSSWLRRLDHEYSRHGDHNMTLLVDVLESLGDIAEEHQVTVPQDVLKKLLWRGLVRPEQQGTVGARLRAALGAFFTSEAATALQRSDPTLFVEYISGVFEFDWMPIEEVLEDTLTHNKLRAELTAEVGKTQEVAAEDPTALLDWDTAVPDQEDQPPGDGDGDGAGWFGAEDSEGGDPFYGDTNEGDGDMEMWGDDYEEEAGEETLRDVDYEEEKDRGDEGHKTRTERDQLVAGQYVEHEWITPVESQAGNKGEALKHGKVGVVKVVEPLPDKMGVKVVDPLPVKVVDPLPVKVVDPLPVKVVDPLPVKVVDPLPVKVVDPLPEKVVKPLPVKVVDPLPVKVVKPLPVKVVEPLPVKGVELLPVKGVEPLPVKEVEPLPVKVVEPLPGKMGVKPTRAPHVKGFNILP